MVKEYESPQFEIINLDETDIICTSGTLPQPAAINKTGANAGEVSYIDLLQ